MSQLEPLYCQVQGPNCKDAATSIIDKDDARIFVCGSCKKPLLKMPQKFFSRRFETKLDRLWGATQYVKGDEGDE